MRSPKRSGRNVWEFTFVPGSIRTQRKGLRWLLRSFKWSTTVHWTVRYGNTKPNICTRAHENINVVKPPTRFGHSCGRPQGCALRKINTLRYHKRYVNQCTREVVHIKITLFKIRITVQNTDKKFNSDMYIYIYIVNCNMYFKLCNFSYLIFYMCTGSHNFCNISQCIYCS
jgi:hypothetical protein